MIGVLAPIAALEEMDVLGQSSIMTPKHREDNTKGRWLSDEEEARLRAVIELNYPDQLPAFDLSLNTGMRKSEQYRRINWDCVDLVQRTLWIPASKNGAAQSIPLNDAELGALEALRERSDGSGVVMRTVGGQGHAAGEALVTPKQWFRSALRKAGIANYTCPSGSAAPARCHAQAGRLGKGRFQDTKWHQKWHRQF